jgi:hypothetical protein
MLECVTASHGKLLDQSSSSGLGPQPENYEYGYQNSEPDDGIVQRDFKEFVPHLVGLSGKITMVLQRIIVSRHQQIWLKIVNHAE